MQCQFALVRKGGVRGGRHPIAVECDQDLPGNGLGAHAGRGTRSADAQSLIWRMNEIWRSALGLAITARQLDRILIGEPGAGVQ